VTSPPTSLNVDSSCDSDADDDSSSFSISALRSSAVSPPVALYRIVTLGTGGRLYARIWPIYIFVTSISDLLLTSSYPFNGPLSVTTRVSRYQKGKTNLDFTEARDSEWQWNQLGQMQVCTSLQTTPAPQRSVFLQAGCPSCRPTNSVKAQKVLIVGPKFTRPACRTAAAAIYRYLLRARARPQQQTRQLSTDGTRRTDGHSSVL